MPTDDERRKELLRGDPSDQWFKVVWEREIDPGMGYYCVFIQIPERILMHLDEDQILGLFERSGSRAARQPPLSQLTPYEAPAMADQTPPPISLEKMWLALHHLLTGEFRSTGSPLSDAILGGKTTKLDVGDGPARYLWADEVREISNALSALTGEELRRRFDPASLKAAWPMSSISDDDDESIFTELESYYRLLTAYYRIAAARRNAILIGVV